MEVRGQVAWCPSQARTDNESKTSIVEILQILRRKHPGIGGDDHIGDPMPVLELFHDRDDRVRFGLVALVAADLQREPVAVDEEPDDDLRVDSALFRVPDSAEVVFLLCLEIQCRDIEKAQRHTAG
jgi:hypothetical protein